MENDNGSMGKSGLDHKIQMCLTSQWEKNYFNLQRRMYSMDWLHWDRLYSHQSTQPLCLTATSPRGLSDCLQWDRLDGQQFTLPLCPTATSPQLLWLVTVKQMGHDPSWQESLVSGWATLIREHFSGIWNTGQESHVWPLYHRTLCLFFSCLACSHFEKLLMSHILILHHILLAKTSDENSSSLPADSSNSAASDAMLLSSRQCCHWCSLSGKRLALMDMNNNCVYPKCKQQ